MPWDVLICALSIFAFIISMIATLGLFFGKRTKWFLLALICVLASGAFMVMELHGILGPPPETDLPLNSRPLMPM